MEPIYTPTYLSRWFADIDIKNRLDFLPKDVDEVVIHNNNVTVKFSDGLSSTAKWNKKDEFDPYIGFCIAYYKGHHIKSFKLKQVLKSCIRSASQKGYKQAILKNK